MSLDMSRFPVKYPEHPNESWPQEREDDDPKTEARIRKAEYESRRRRSTDRET